MVIDVQPLRGTGGQGSVSSQTKESASAVLPEQCGSSVRHRDVSDRGPFTQTRFSIPSAQTAAHIVLRSSVPKSVGEVAGSPPPTVPPHNILNDVVLRGKPSSKLDRVPVHRRECVRGSRSADQGTDYIRRRQTTVTGKSKYAVTPPGERVPGSPVLSPGSPKGSRLRGRPGHGAHQEHHGCQATTDR